jgi:dTDP-4-amino-4,6-dideoxygalactose transaminase
MPDSKLSIYNSTQLKKVSSILKSGKVNFWTGQEVILFEKEFSKYLGSKYSVALSNGSVALELALRAADLRKGDEVIVTPRSFVISASCVLNIGLKPVFADVDDNGNLSIGGILKVYRKSVKAIIVVHLNGLSCDLDPIIKFTKKNKIFLIEDCSQAHGAFYKGKSVGTFGDISTWSFCQDKIISTGGEGGMISTNNKKIWKKCWSYKDHGKNYHSVFYKKHKPGFRWLIDQLGSNYRLTEMQATLGRYQLKYLDKQIRKRNQIAYLYINGLKDFWIDYDLLKKPNFICSTCPLKDKISKQCNFCLHAFYRLNLFINSKKINQIKLINELNKEKISCQAGPCPDIYREKIFKKLKIYPKKRLANAKLLGETSIVFTINPLSTLSKVTKQIISIKSIISKYL